MQTSLFYSCCHTNRALLHASSFSRKLALLSIGFHPQELHHLLGTMIFHSRQQVPDGVQNSHRKCCLEPVLLHTEGLMIVWGLIQSLLQADPGSGCAHRRLAARTREPLPVLVSAVAPLTAPPTWRHGAAGRLRRQADLTLCPGCAM